MQNAVKLVSITYPRITVVHGAEHVLSLFFKDIFTKMQVFQCLSQFSKRCRNIFGSTHHGPHAISMNNNCIYIGFIKISKCRMAGELIRLLCLLRQGIFSGQPLPPRNSKIYGQKVFRERSLLLKTMSSGSICFHCVVLSMPQCVSFD